MYRRKIFMCLVQSYLEANRCGGYAVSVFRSESCRLGLVGGGAEVIPCQRTEDG
jgi:hypothetical protein